MEKIKKIETFTYTGCGGKEYLLVRLEGDKGTIGAGEATLSGQNAQVAELIAKVVAPAVVGRELCCANYLESTVFPRDKGQTALRCAVSGVEIASWDAIGKSKGQPVWKLLGGSVYPDMTVIAPEGGTKDFGAARRSLNVEAYNSEMFAKLNRAQEQVGCPLVVDVCGEMDTRRGAELLHSMEKLAQEPLYVSGLLTDENRGDWTALSHNSKVPLAAQLSSRHDALSAVQEAAMSVLEADVLQSGGIGAMKLLATFGETFYMNLAGCCSGGAVAAAAAAQVLYSCPNVRGVDYPADDFAAILCRPFQILPDETPGIGVEVDWAKL